MLKTEITIDGVVYTLNTRLHTAFVSNVCEDSKKVVIAPYVSANNQQYPVTSIGKNAFWNSTNLVSVSIHEGITRIGDGAFQHCPNLVSVSIPDSTTSIGEGAFRYCASLASIVVGSGNRVYDSRNNCNAIIETNTGTLITGCKDTIIPFGVTGIGDHAFEWCQGITSVTIPDGVTSIGSHAFDNCDSLVSVTIPDSVTQIADAAFSGCAALTSVTIPDGIKRIEANTFGYCSALTSITIPQSVTSIGEWAFCKCSNLTSITLLNSVKRIEDFAFKDCAAIASIIIPRSVTTIGKKAFAGCSALTAIVVEQGNCVYDSCNNCNAIIETETNTLIAGCQSTIIPYGIIHIGEGAFSGCTHLTSISIPRGVTTIGNDAFEDCSALTSVTLPDGITSMGEEGFCDYVIKKSGFDKLLAGSIGIFANCENLSVIRVPKGKKRAYCKMGLEPWRKIIQISSTRHTDD